MGNVLPAPCLLTPAPILMGDSLPFLLVAGGGLPLMAAGGSAGVVTVWNLEERKLHSVLRDAHDGPLVGGGDGGWQAEKGLQWPCQCVGPS